MQVTDLVKTLGAVRALDGVSLTVDPGEILGCIGPNAAGKTTLIRCIAGLLRADRGTVRVLDRSVPDRSVQSEIGYMTQQAALYPDLTVGENIAFFASMNGSDGTIDTVLDVVDLRGVRHRLVGQLSGGTRQRCSLACALVHRPRVLLLDEPTVGVDPQLRRQFWAYFAQLATDGCGIIVSSHVLDEAEHCSRLVMMRRGRVIADGTLESLLSTTGTHRLEDAFLSLAEEGDE